MQVSRERTAVLVVRVWRGDDTPAHLRARITRTMDLQAGERIITTASTAEEIEATFRSWLDAFNRV